MKKTILAACICCFFLSGCCANARVSQVEKTDYPVICTLQTRYFTIALHSGPEDVCYTVIDRVGNMILSQASEQELQSELPRLHDLLKKSITWAGF